MNNVLPVIEAHRFEPQDFVGGDPALDFINTVTGRDVEPRDWLDGYERLVEWAGRAELLPPRMLRALARMAQAEPVVAAAALARAKALREALFTLMSALAAGRTPPANALALVRKGWIAGVEAHELRYASGQVVATLDEDAVDLDLIAAIVAWRVVEFVLPLPGERLRICAGPNCSWLFVDRSKAGRRRWCDMAVCGNAAKSRRFHARSQRKRTGTRR